MLFFTFAENSSRNTVWLELYYCYYFCGSYNKPDIFLGLPKMEEKKVIEIWLIAMFGP